MIAGAIVMLCSTHRLQSAGRPCRCRFYEIETDIFRLHRRNRASALRARKNSRSIPSAAVRQARRPLCRDRNQVRIRIHADQYIQLDSARSPPRHYIRDVTNSTTASSSSLSRLLWRDPLSAAWHRPASPVASPCRSSRLSRLRRDRRRPVDQLRVRDQDHGRRGAVSKPRLRRREPDLRAGDDTRAGRLVGDANPSSASPARSRSACCRTC